MPRRSKKTLLWPRGLQRRIGSLTRTVMRASAKALARSLQPAAKKRTPVKRRNTAQPASPAARTRPGVVPASVERFTRGTATTTLGSRHYRLYRPPGIRSGERLPLLVLLHGCGQDAAALATCSRMNRVAARERFLVLYPEQDRLHNAHACWNWYDTRSGRAQAEAAIIDGAVDLVCRRAQADPSRIVLAGLSAGAGMAALLATLRPDRYRAVAMHSGVAPGVANSTATALAAMRGGRAAPGLARTGSPLPPLLVIHGTADPVVAARNGRAAVERWAARAGATPGAPRTVQRGSRRPARVTEFRTGDGQLAATLCEVEGLGHAWSGGATGQAYSDPTGPDASRLIWRFCAKRLAIRVGDE